MGIKRDLLGVRAGDAVLRQDRVLLGALRELRPLRQRRHRLRQLHVEVLLDGRARRASRTRRVGQSDPNTQNGHFDGLKIGGQVGVGAHIYFNEWFGLQFELRDYIVGANPGGLDTNGDRKLELGGRRAAEQPVLRRRPDLHAAADRASVRASSAIAPRDPTDAARALRRAAAARFRATARRAGTA